MEAAGNTNLLDPNFLSCVLIQHAEELNEIFLMGTLNMTFTTFW